MPIPPLLPSAVEQANADQGQGMYPGRDPWIAPAQGLPKGTLLAHLDWRSLSVIEAKRAAVSNYFTDVATLDQSKTPNGEYSPRKLAELVQVGPRRRRPDQGEHQYNPHIVVYKLERELRPNEFAEAPVKQNPHFGPGQGKQFFVTIDKEELVQKGVLSVETVHVGLELERSHGLPWLSTLEQAGKTNDDISRATTNAFREYVRVLESGKEWRDVQVPLDKLLPLPEGGLNVPVPGPTPTPPGPPLANAPPPYQDKLFTAAELPYAQLEKLGVSREQLEKSGQVPALLRGERTQPVSGFAVQLPAADRVEFAAHLQLKREPQSQAVSFHLVVPAEIKELLRAQAKPAAPAAKQAVAPPPPKAKPPRIRR